MDFSYSEKYYGKNCRGNQKTHFMFNYSFFKKRKSCRLLDNVEKYGRGVQVTGGCMAQEHYMLSN
jgi:hypothetical protein